MMEKYDVVIIGSGINSLTAAAFLAKKGKSVLVLEKNDYLGGCIKTAELTVPGFKHDVFSGFHPLFVSGPAYASLKEDLDQAGLTYQSATFPTGVLLPDNQSALLHQDMQQNIDHFNQISAGDGNRLPLYLETVQEHLDLAMGVLGKELWSWDGSKMAMKSLFSMGGSDLISFTGKLLPSVRKELDHYFESPLIKALLAPWVLHAGMGTEDAGSSFMNKVVVSTLQQVGNPVPLGGGDQLVKSLVQVINSHGGILKTNHEVQSVWAEHEKVRGVITAQGKIEAEYVLANTTPTQLFGELLKEYQVPDQIKKEVAGYQYGLADMQIHLALDKPPAWPDPQLNETAIVHLTSGLDGVSRAVNEATRGLLPDQATIVVGQPGAADTSRMPSGKWIIWIQLQELPAFPTGDARGEINVSGSWREDIKIAYADRIIERLEAQLPGFKKSIAGKSILSPADLSAANPNLVQGDPYSGKATLDQFLFWRPLPSLRGHGTPIKNLYQIGASTHPGPGLAGTSGYLVATTIT
ncbi:MAG: phytoene desaturase family protein [Candidatus Cyclobacteriaceae bacterium M3_2C_046]